MGVLLRLRARVSLVLSVVSLAADCHLLPSAHGQVAGHYIGGATGLEDGSTAPPGFYGTFFPVVERVNALKGPGGATIAKPNINVVANMAAYAVTTENLGGGVVTSMTADPYGFVTVDYAEGNATYGPTPGSGGSGGGAFYALNTRTSLDTDSTTPNFAPVVPDLTIKYDTPATKH